MSATTIQEVTPSTDTTVKELTAHDRCDGCGSQAYLKYALLAGGEVLLCFHHNRKHGNALKDVAVLVQDESHKLMVKPSM